MSGINNDYLKKFEVHYSTDCGNIYRHHFSASTDNQYSNDWAWIEFKYKKANKKIDLHWRPRNKPEVITSLLWIDSKQKLEVANDLYFVSSAWCKVKWYPEKSLINKITRIQVIAKWYNAIQQKIEEVTLVYILKPIKTKLNSNSLHLSNSSPKEEIRTDAKDYTVKAYKEANTIVVKGAINKNIQVSTTSGKLVKSMVADCDVLQIPVPANQFYIVNVGQTRYKLAL